MEGASSGQHISPPIHHAGPVPPPSRSPPISSKRPRVPPRRKKVKIEWIKDDAHRRSTFNKRKRGVMRKAEELQVLCGVETCVVIYGDNEGESRPEVWPSWEKAAEMCQRFRTMPGHEVIPRTMNHVSFTEDRMQKLRKQIARLEREIGDICIRGLLYDGLLGRDFRPSGAIKVALVKMILELSTEIRLELAARRRREAPAAAPPTRPPLLSPAWLGPAQTPPLLPVELAPQASLLPPQEGLRGPLFSPGWSNVYCPWELTMGAAHDRYQYGEDDDEHGGNLGYHPLFNLY